MAGLISGFPLTPVSCPGSLPVLVTTTVLPERGQYPLGAPEDGGKLSPPTSLLAPSLATCLEAKLGEIPSWNFSFRSWDEIVPTGKQLGI